MNRAPASSYPQLYNFDGTRASILDKAYEAHIQDAMLDANGGQEILDFNMPWGDPKIPAIRNEMEVHFDGVVFKVRLAQSAFDSSGGLTFAVHCEAKWYDLGSSPPRDVWTALTPVDAMNAAVSGTDWTVGVVQPTASGALTTQANMSALAVLRSIPSVYGGELQFDTVNKTVSLLNARGGPTGLLYARGKNATQDQIVIDTTNLYTRVYPTGANDIDITSVNGGTPFLQDVSYFTNQGAPVQIRSIGIQNTSLTTPDQVKSWGQGQLDTYAQPAISYTIGIVVLKTDTIPNIGDTVRVWDKVLGLQTNARVVGRNIYPLQPDKSTLTINTAVLNMTTALSGGKGGVTQISSPVAPTDGDSIAPNPPEGLSVVGVDDIDMNGNHYERAQIMWSAPSTNVDGSGPVVDLQHYDVRYYAGGNPTDLVPDGTWYDLGMIAYQGSPQGLLTPEVPSGPITALVRAVDISGNASDWASATGTIPIPAGDTEPPSDPVLDAASLPLTILAKWDGKMQDGSTVPKDFRYVEVHFSTDSTFATGDQIIGTLTEAGAYPITGVTPGTQYSVRFVAKSNFGYTSNPSNTVSATVLPVGPSNIRYAGDWGNRVPDGSFETAGNRAAIVADNPGSTGMSFVGSPVDNGGWALRFDASAAPTAKIAYLVRDVPTLPGNQLWVKARVYNRSTGGGLGIVQVVWKDRAGAATAIAIPNVAANGGYATTSGVVTLPAGAVTYSIEVGVSGGTGGDVLFDGVETRDVIQTAIIGSAAVTDAQIGSVSAGKLVAGSVLGVRIVVAGVLTTSSSSDGSGNPTGPRIDLKSSGLYAYDAAGSTTFSLNSADGSATFKGNILSGSTITAPTIIGGNIYATSFATSQNVYEGGTTRGIVIGNSSAFGQWTMQFYTGDTAEQYPGEMWHVSQYISGSSGPRQAQIGMRTPFLNSYGSSSSLNLYSRASDNSKAGQAILEAIGTSSQIVDLIVDGNNGVSVTGGNFSAGVINASGRVTGAGLTSTSGLTVTGSGTLSGSISAGSWSGTLLPAAANSYDIGSSGTRWNTIWATTLNVTSNVNTGATGGYFCRNQTDWISYDYGAFAGQATVGSTNTIKFYMDGSYVAQLGARTSIAYSVVIAASTTINSGTKTFVIDHPTKAKKNTHYLVHAAIEGPENTVFYRGKGKLKKGVAVVKLPAYFTDLCDEDTATVQITPIAERVHDHHGVFNAEHDCQFNGEDAEDCMHQHTESPNLTATEVKNGKFWVGRAGGFTGKWTESAKFHWMVIATRKDVPELEIEPSRDKFEVAGDGPYTYLRKKATA